MYFSNGYVLYNQLLGIIFMITFSYLLENHDKSKFKLNYIILYIV